MSERRSGLVGIRGAKVAYAPDAAKRVTGTGRGPGGPAGANNRLSAAPGIPRPALHRGACVSDQGRALMDAVQNREFGAAPTARAMCQRQCPVFAECFRWVTQAETPAGAWGGFWAGMSAKERRNRHGVSA